MFRILKGVTLHENPFLKVHLHQCLLCQRLQRKLAVGWAVEHLEKARSGEGGCGEQGCRRERGEGGGGGRTKDTWPKVPVPSTRRCSRSPSWIPGSSAAPPFPLLLLPFLFFFIPPSIRPKLASLPFLFAASRFITPSSGPSSRSKSWGGSGVSTVDLVHWVPIAGQRIEGLDDSYGAKHERGISILELPHDRAT